LVRLGGSLALLAGTSQTELTLDEPLPLCELARRVGVEPSLVMVYAVNGTVQRADFAPADGDEVVLVPAVAGGGPASD
jgi:molybdopterin converting factor small subunit